MHFAQADNLKYIFSTIKSSFLPACLLLIALVSFYAGNPYEKGTSLFLHYAFLAISALALSLLYLSNRSKPFFSLLLGTICYLLINAIKIHYGADFALSAEYRCLCFGLPLNFALFYFLPQSKLSEPRNKYLLLALLGEIALFQHCGDFINFMPYVDITLESMPLWACVFWVLMLAPLAMDISFKNTIVNTGLFYADSALFMGLIYAGSASGITGFFLAFVLILFCVTVTDMYRRYHYDYLNGVYSKTTYLNNAQNKFPFKYTIALFSVDNRDKLQQVIGSNKLQVLEQMIIDKIKTLPYELTLYRYNESELIMVFKNEDAKHVREFADNIRHVVAAAEFILAGKKSLKITISVCVSEKTRKDLNATEVTERAHNALQKSYRFNCNITIVAA